MQLCGLVALNHSYTTHHTLDRDCDWPLLSLKSLIHYKCYKCKTRVKKFSVKNPLHLGMEV